MNRFLKAFFHALLILLLLQGCIGDGKKDVITATMPVDKLKDDLLLLKSILTDVHAGTYIFNSPAQISQLFDSIAHSIDEPLTTREFCNKVDCIIDRLRCIHSATVLPAAYYDSISNRAMFFPVPLVVINNKLYVNSASFTVPLGSEILTVNNKRSKLLISRLQPYYHTDGYSNTIRNSAIDDDFAFNYYLAFGAEDRFVLEWREPETDSVKRGYFEAEKLNDINKKAYDQTFYYFPGDAPYDLHLIDSSSTALMTIRTFYFETDATLTAYDHFVENSFRLIRQSGIKNLVIDCRNNTGGFYASTYKLLSHLVNQRLPEFDSSIKRYNKLPYPDYVDVDDSDIITRADTTAYKFSCIRKGVYAEKKQEIREWEPDKSFFKGSLFVIINGKVVSAAATFTSILKDKANAVIVGEESGGGNAEHNSSIITYMLPNSKIKIDIPTIRFYQPVSHRLAGRGVIPHKYIPLTVEDLISFTDAPLQYILDSAIANKLKISDLKF